MATDAFEEPLNFGGSKLTEGRTYTIELTEIIKQNKVVAPSTILKGKGVVGKEYDALTDAEKKIVDDSPVEMDTRAGRTPREKPKFINRITFQFVEPDSQIKFLYDAQFDMSLDNYPTKKLRDFVQRATGISVQGDEGFTWGTLFKRGEKFLAAVRRNGAYFGIDIDTIVKAQLAAPVVVGEEGLSVDAKSLLEYIKNNLVGEQFSVIVDVFTSGAGGAIVTDANGDAYAKTRDAWAELRQKSVSFSLDGKTFGFA